MLQLDNPVHAAQWLRERVRGNLHTDSRKVQAGDGFIAWPGAAVDGRQFVGKALLAGASACVVEAMGVEEFHFVDERVAAYAGLKAASGPLAAQVYEHPSHHMDVLAVTGTNGKTSTAWWLAQALNTLQKPRVDNLLLKSELLAQYACGIMGTLGVGKPGNLTFTGLTTPDPVMLQTQLQQMLRCGAVACAIEASSIGVAEHRLDGTRIRVAIFTNFTQDHLDYHGSMQAYWQAKLALFDWPGLQTAVVNVDDPKGVELAQLCNDKGLDVWTVSRLTNSQARLQATDLQYSATGMQFVVREGQNHAQVNAPLIGDYNVSNLLGVLATLRALGHSLQAACEVMLCLSAVPGRLECLVHLGQPMVAVDYAHTPDALEKVLAALRAVTQARGGKLWCVFGCGGDRDASKRPRMAAAAEQGADHVVVTSDNPRSEAASAIMDDVMRGFQKPAQVTKQADRALAIMQTIQQAAVIDVVVIAGKGHEDYQEIAGVKHAFSDMAHVNTALRVKQQANNTVQQEPAA